MEYRADDFGDIVRQLRGDDFVELLLPKFARYGTGFGRDGLLGFRQLYGGVHCLNGIRAGVAVYRMERIGRQLVCADGVGRGGDDTVSPQKQNITLMIRCAYALTELRLQHQKGQKSKATGKDRWLYFSIVFL